MKKILFNEKFGLTQAVLDGPTPYVFAYTFELVK